MVSFFMTVVALSTLPLLLCEECGEIITQSTYTLTSPNHPKKYPNDLECKWKISVEESSRIHLWFTYFQFEKDEDSSCFDYLRMWDGGDDGADRVFLSCAESLEDFKAENNGNASFNSSGNVFYLWMTTDSFIRKRGFSATFVSIPGPPSTTETNFGSTSRDAQSTHLKRTTADWASTPQDLIVSITTPFAVFSTSLTANSINPVTAVSENISTNVPLTITLANRSTTTRESSSDIPPTLEPDENSSSSILLVVVPTVSFVLLLACLCVTGLFLHTRRSSGKSNTSSTDSSCHDVGTDPVRTVEEQCEPYNKTLYCTNESFHASPQDTYPPPYQSIKSADDFRTAHMNFRILQSEEIIGDVAYENFDGEEKRNSDYSANAGNIVNIAYESYDEEDIADNDDYTANVGEVGNIAYESYGGQENVDNGDYTANVGEVSNIAYQSYDGQGKVENDDNVLHEGETSNVVYESYDRQENSGNSDDAANRGEVSNDAYESYDGENNVTDDTDEVSREYQTIDDSQSVDDDYSNIRC